jgi:hypothetical protein
MNTTTESRRTDETMFAYVELVTGSSSVGGGE